MPSLRALEMSWMILGLQLTINNIFSLANTILPIKELTKKKREALQSFKNRIGRALLGNDIVQKRSRSRSRKATYKLDMPFNEAVEAECAYREIGYLFPADYPEKKKVQDLKQLEEVCVRILDGTCSREDKKFVEQFCERAHERLEQEYSSLSL